MLTSDVSRIEAACRVTADAVRLAARSARAGMTTRELDALVEDFIRSCDGEPAFKGYVVDGKAFPASVCTSIDDEVVHGIPGDRVLEEGMLLSIDIGVKKDGFYGDSATTVAIGMVDPEKARLMRVTRESLEHGIAVVRDGVPVHEIGRAVQEYCEANSFGVVRELCGHGVGSRLHMEPSVPNFVPTRSELRHFRNVPLTAGMTIAIEPMVNAGSHQVRVRKDGWTVVTADGAPSAHFEHTVLVTATGAEILTQ